MKRTDENEIDDYTRMKKLTLYGWLVVSQYGSSLLS